MLLIPNAINEWTKFRFFSTRTSGKSIKLFTRKLCQAYDETCMCIYNKRMLIAQDCVKFRGHRAWVYCMTEITCKQLCWFPGYGAGKKIKILFSCWWRFELATSPITNTVKLKLQFGFGRDVPLGICKWTLAYIPIQKKKWPIHIPVGLIFSKILKNIPIHIPSFRILYIDKPGGWVCYLCLRHILIVTLPRDCLEP